MTQRKTNEIRTWGELFRSKKARLQRQGRTVATARYSSNPNKLTTAEEKLRAMRRDYEMTKKLLLGTVAF